MSTRARHQGLREFLPSRRERQTDQGLRFVLLDVFERWNLVYVASYQDEVFNFASQNVADHLHSKCNVCHLLG